MEAGSTFCLAEVHTEIDDHLWVVLSEPEQNPESVLLVSITTLRPHKDQACLIHRGEHPWVTHDSCVAYDFARTVTLKQLNALKDSGRIVLRERLSELLLTRIRRAAADSTRLEMRFADLLIEQGLLDC